MTSPCLTKTRSPHLIGIIDSSLTFMESGTLHTFSFLVITIKQKVFEKTEVGKIISFYGTHREGVTPFVEFTLTDDPTDGRGGMGEWYCSTETRLVLN